MCVRNHKHDTNADDGAALLQLAGLDADVCGYQSQLEGNLKAEVLVSQETPPSTVGSSSHCGQAEMGGATDV